MDKSFDRKPASSGLLNVPFIPMHRILCQYVKAHNIPLRMNRMEEVTRAFMHYNEVAKRLN